MNQRENTKLTHRQLLRRILAVAILIIAFLAVLFFIKQWDIKHGLFPVPEETSATTTTNVIETLPEENMKIRYNDQWYVMRDNLETVLIIGLDKFESSELNNSYDNDRQSDFLLLGVLDHAHKRVYAIHINRDTMTDVPVLGVLGEVVGTQNEQIALSFTYGSGGHDSCRNTIRAVSGLLYDLPIDHYITVTMDAVALLNDSVDGVDLQVLDDMTATNPAWRKGAQIHLSGDQALQYVRSRKGLADSTNVTRMRRQRQYMKALYQKVIENYRMDENFLMDTSMKLADHIATDYSINRLQEVVDATAKYESRGIRSIKGKSVLGDEYMEFYVDEDALQALVVKLFFTPEK